MYCFKCKKQLDLPNKKIGFRDMCNFCEADLHVCKNCRHYIVGKPNNCNVPNTEYLSDREKFNFCEDFSKKENLEKDETKSKKDIENKLFKDSDDDSDESQGFDSLFKE